jgi:integrase
MTRYGKSGVRERRFLRAALRSTRCYYTPSDSSRSRLIVRLCEAFISSGSAVKPHARYTFGILRFGPQSHGRTFLLRDDACHVAKSSHPLASPVDGVCAVACGTFQIKDDNLGAALHPARARFAAASLASALSPHSLRHSFITLALSGGAGLPMLQAAARHPSPQTTMRSAHVMDSLDNNAVDEVNW